MTETGTAVVYQPVDPPVDFDPTAEQVFDRAVRAAHAADHFKGLLNLATVLKLRAHLTRDPAFEGVMATLASELDVARHERDAMLAVLDTRFPQLASSAIPSWGLQVDELVHAARHGDMAETVAIRFMDALTRSGRLPAPQVPEAPG